MKLYITPEGLRDDEGNVGVLFSGTAKELHEAAEILRRAYCPICGRKLCFHFDEHSEEKLADAEYCPAGDYLEEY